MNEREQLVRPLGLAEVAAVVDVLGESFRDYPVMRFVLGEEGDYDSRLQSLIRFFVMARTLRGEVVLGIGDATKLNGAALVSDPDGPESPPELARAREELWLELGDAARTRYEAFGEACADFDVGVPHLHLNMIGVRREQQGRGTGRALLDHVHRMSHDDPGSQGVTLTTEVEGNVPLYERFGYEIMGRARVSDELQTWALYRPDNLDM